MSEKDTVEQAILTVRAAEDLEVREMDALRKTLQECLQQGASAILLDLSPTYFISEEAAASLFGCVRDMRDYGAPAVLVCSHPFIQKKLKRLGFDYVLPVYTDVESALAALQSPVAWPGVPGSVPREDRLPNR